RAPGVRWARLLPNNPRKARALNEAGIRVQRIVGLPTAAHTRNARYLTTKQARMRHEVPMGPPLGDGVGPPVDVGSLLGSVRPSATKPYVVVKYAQARDGRAPTPTRAGR